MYHESLSINDDNVEVDLNELYEIYENLNLNKDCQTRVNINGFVIVFEETMTHCDRNCNGVLKRS